LQAVQRVLWGMKLKSKITSKLTLLVTVSIIFLILPTITNALNTVFDGKIYSGQTITAEDQVFKVYLGTNNFEVLADYGIGTLFLLNNSCQQTSQVRLCIDNIELEIETRLYKIDIRAISLKPEITITRTILRTEYKRGEEVVITASVENTGGLASDVTYTDVFPDGITVVSRDGISGTSRGVRWSGNLKEGQKESFTYTIKLSTIMDKTLAAKLTYYDGTRIQTLFSDIIRVKTTPLLRHDLILGKDKLLVGEPSNVTINFTSSAAKTINIDRLDVIADSSISFISLPYGFKKIGENVYRWSGVIKQTSGNATNKSIDHFMKFRVTKVGTANIKMRVDYSIGTFSNSLPEITRAITVENKGVIIRTNLDDLDLESNQARSLKIWFQNQNPFVEIKNALITLDTKLTTLKDVYIPFSALVLHLDCDFLPDLAFN